MYSNNNTAKARKARIKNAAAYKNGHSTELSIPAVKTAQNTASLSDGIAALIVKRDALNEAIAVLEELMNE